MQIPKLQVALDTTSMVEGFSVLGNGLDDIVDIIEVGTMLILHEGLSAVDFLRTIYKDKLLVADFKCIAPHFGSQILKRDPDFLTVLSAAEHHVKQQIFNETIQRGHGQQVQVEIYGEYSIDDIKEWKSIGIHHVIYSRPRTRTGLWSNLEADDIKELIDLGMIVTATGGMSYENLDSIAGLPVYAIICGSSVIKSSNPAAEAAKIKNRMTELWN